MTVNYSKTRRACFFAYLSMSSVFVLPPMLFVTFNEMYGISYTLLGTLVLVNFCTQMVIDTVFTFFSKHFNIKATVRIMPFLTSLGLIAYALLPDMMPNNAFIGLAVGTVLFSVAAGLCEVLLSPMVAACPSSNPERDMSLLHSLYGWGVVGSVVISAAFFNVFGTQNWKYLTLFFALLPLIASVFFCLSPIPEMKTDSDGIKKKSTGKGMILCVMCIFLGSAAENAMTNWISSFMETALNIPKSAVDIFGLAIFALLLAVTRNVYAKYTPDISKTLLVSMIGAATCYAVIGLVPNAVISFIACILVGMFTSMLWPGTLILMEEKIPSVGVAAFALMAAGGDMGASVAPQLLGVVVDKVSASSFASELGIKIGMAPEQIGMKVGMLIASMFPIIGTVVVICIIRSFSSKKEVN